MSTELTLKMKPLPTLMVRYRLLLVITAHAILFTLALLSAFLLAYNFRHLARWFAPLFLPLLGLALPVKLLVFYFTRQYRGSWRYVGLRDLLSVMSASLVGTFLFIIVYFVLENSWHVIVGKPLIDRATGSELGGVAGAILELKQSSVFALDWAATIAFVAGARIFVRFYYEDIQRRPIGDPNRVLIVGAGDAGEALLREMLRMRPERYQCVGFLDDDVPQLHGEIHGVEVLGRTQDIRELAISFDVREILIALPQASPRNIRDLVEQCEGTGILFRTVPAVTDLIEGRVQVSQIRNVDIADLLGREPVMLDTMEIGRQLKGKRVLVTGAGGSIGSEMCRQIAVFQPERLVLLEQAENSLFEIDRELRRRNAGLRIVPCIGDIIDRARLSAVFEQEQPNIVFHAAAHKHVPMMESNAGEAVKNNIGGTLTVAEVAIASGVEKMVMISTDKAVNPTSIMGCTKRVAEMYVQSLGKESVTQFVTVRFGNVLGSSGSVVPIFRQQIADGGPLTVTHPEMTRYFMTIQEAAQLVLQAGAMGKGSEIYVLHMGEPVKITDLARDMITLSGLRPGLDIEIVFTGKRPGEKLYEELSHAGEHVGDTAHPKIGIWKHRVEDAKTVHRGVERLLRMAESNGTSEIREELKRLVPEFTQEKVTEHRGIELVTYAI